MIPKSREELIKQRTQLEMVLDYMKLAEELLDQQEQMKVAVDKIDDRNSLKLQMFKTDMNRILRDKEDQ